LGILLSFYRCCGGKACPYGAARRGPPPIERGFIAAPSRESKVGKAGERLAWLR
jgi:hypothetical protein